MRNFTRFLPVEKEQRQRLLEDYANELQDLPTEALLLGMRAVLNDAKERYCFPSIGEIRQAAVASTTAILPTSAEAWDSCLHGTAAKDGVAYQVFRQLGYDQAELGRMGYHEAGNCQGRYLTCYREAVARQATEAKFPPGVRTVAGQAQAQVESARQADARATQKAEEDAAARRWFGAKAAEIESKRAQQPAKAKPATVGHIDNVRDISAYVARIRRQG